MKYTFYISNAKWDFILAEYYVWEVTNQKFLGKKIHTFLNQFFAFSFLILGLPIPSQAFL